MSACNVLVADVPWRFGDKLPGPGRGASKRYDCMSIADVCRFPLPPLADDAWLFFWRVGSMQSEALQVIAAWGFDLPTSEIVWVKTTGDGHAIELETRNGRAAPRLRWGMGRTVRNCHEVALVCRRGKPKRASASVPSVIFAPRGEHSAKPDAFYEAVEKLTGPEAVRVELFARRERAGWSTYGNELAEAHPPLTERRP